MRSFTVKDNHIGLVDSEIILYSWGGFLPQKVVGLKCKIFKKLDMP